jgi:hypothetical protein
MGENRDWWLENAPCGRADFVPPHTLVDLGYVGAQPARDRADRVLEVVGRKNLQLAGNGRIVVRIPPKKVAAVLDAFPDIRPAGERPGYCWCTHSWLCPESGDIRYATR